MKTLDEIVRYEELKNFVTDQGIEIPDDLHTRKREVEKRELDPEEQRAHKLCLLAMAQRDYPDIGVSQAEIVAEINRQDLEEQQIDELLKSQEG